MEHRSGTRMPLDLEARLHLSRRRTVAARVRDISMGGMRVRAAGRFRVHQRVVVEFTFPVDSRARRWRASIVHVTTDSAGLMFDRLHSDDLPRLLAPSRPTGAEPDP